MGPPHPSVNRAFGAQGIDTRPKKRIEQEVQQDAHQAEEAAAGARPQVREKQRKRGKR